MKNSQEYRHPPRLAERFLESIYPDRGCECPLGDFGEVYNRRLDGSHPLKAGIWYWWQVLKSIPPCIRNAIYWRQAMLWSYLKIAYRTIVKNRVYSMISIMGLAIGIACCSLIALWIFDELSCDRFHRDGEYIYQVLSHGSMLNNPSTPLPFAPVFKDAYPEVVYATRYEGFDEALIGRGDQVFYEDGIKVVDQDFFKIFTFPFVKGDPETALDQIHSIVISETIAEKYFGHEEPLGQTLTMNHQQDFTVTGVVKNAPGNSTIWFEIFIPYEYKLRLGPERGFDPTSWGHFSPNTFVKLHEDLSIDAFGAKIADFYERHDEREDATLSLLPFTERYFFFWDARKYIVIYSAIAAFVLILACINFINLSTARTANRSCEIGLRKVTGANWNQLFVQFLGESFLMTLLAFVIGVFIVTLLLPYFNALTSKTLTYSSFLNRSNLWRLLGLFVATGTVSGCYPAFYTSSLQPSKILRDDGISGTSSAWIRRVLVVFQFSISVFLIIGTGTIYRQLHFLKHKDIGYRKEGLITIPLEGNTRIYFNLLKERLLRHDRIIGVTGTADDLPYFNWSTASGDWEGKDPDFNPILNVNRIGYDFFETLGIQMVAGRPFSEEFSMDAENGIIVNQKMLEIMGLESGIGARFTNWGQAKTIIGVIPDVHFQRLTHRIGPIYFYMESERSYLYNLVIRIAPGDLPSTLAFIRKTWEAVVPLYPFKYRFVADELDRSFRSIERMGRLMNIFAVIAVFVACLGLYGLASFTAVQRSKEMGIRKVLGSSARGIVFLLSKEFAKCVLIANVIAWPAAFFVMNRWLRGFSYRIGIRPEIFLLSGMLAFVIAIVTVSYQAMKVARAKPVDSIRYE